MEVQCTAREMISVLERTSIATVVVEGSTDMKLYRWIEGAIPRGVIVLPVGGRTNLLEIYKERKRFKVPVAFVADRDLWSFTDCPREYSEVVFTSGFSIENDVLADSAVEQILSPKEKAVMDKCVQELSVWYAYEVGEYLAGRTCFLDQYPGKLLNGKALVFSPAILNPRKFRSPPADFVKQVQDDFKMKFRGKSLLLLYHFIQEVGDQGVRFSNAALLEMATKLLETSPKKRLVFEIRKALERTGYPSMIQT